MNIKEAAKLFETIGVAGYNKPKKTPNHPTKSHVVVAKKAIKLRLFDLVSKAKKAVQMVVQGIKRLKQDTLRT